MIQRAPDGSHVFYPRVASPSTGAVLEWVEASGRGIVHAQTINRAREGAYNVALVDLAEGARMLSCVEDVESVPIGTAVRRHAGCSFASQHRCYRARQSGPIPGRTAPSELGLWSATSLSSTTG